MIEPPAPVDLAALRPELRAAAGLLATGGVVAVLLRALGGAPDAAWIAWAAASYASWTAALLLLARRRLAAAAQARPLPRPQGADGLRTRRGHGAGVALVSGAVAAGWALDATELAAGFLLAAGTTAAASARWTAKLERLLGGELHRNRSLRGLTSERLWISK